MHFVIVKISGISTLTIKLFIFIYIFSLFFLFFFLPLVFLGFLVHPGSEPLTEDSQRVPYEKTSLGFKDYSKQGHKTKRDYLFLLTTVRRE